MSKILVHLARKNVELNLICCYYLYYYDFFSKTFCIRGGVSSHSGHCQTLWRGHWTTAAPEASEESQEQAQLGNRPMQFLHRSVWARLMNHFTHKWLVFSCVVYRHYLNLWFVLLQLEDWWLDTAYLEVRIPSQLNVNFGGPTAYVEHCWPVRDGTQLERTSLNLWLVLQYWDLIRT